jgi:hypothetical protein
MDGTLAGWSAADALGIRIESLEIAHLMEKAGVETPEELKGLVFVRLIRCSVHVVKIWLDQHLALIMFTGKACDKAAIRDTIQGLLMQCVDAHGGRSGTGFCTRGS